VNVNDAVALESIEQMFAGGSDLFQLSQMDFRGIDGKASLWTRHRNGLPAQLHGLLTGQKVSLVAFGHERWTLSG